MTFKEKIIAVGAGIIAAIMFILGANLGKKNDELNDVEEDITSQKKVVQSSKAKGAKSSKKATQASEDHKKVTKATTTTKKTVTDSHNARKEASGKTIKKKG